MSEQLFQVTDQVVPASHLREFPHGVRNESATLQLAVKRYVPRNSPDPLPRNAITILAAHAAGIPKETYEPLFDTLLQLSTSSSAPFVIRSIVIADAVHLGQSYWLNAPALGNDPGWHDHARDLLALINILRPPRPVFAIGHSMACAQLLQLSLLHPRMIHSLILCEPVITKSRPQGPNIAVSPTLRRDRWGDRAEAEKFLRERSFLKKWDSRCLDLYIRWGLVGEKPTVLASPKAQEAWSFNRSNFRPLPTTDTERRVDRLIDPTSAGFPESELAFLRPETFIATEDLPRVRPSVLYIYGADSVMAHASLRREKMQLTGTGRGGNQGMVKEVLIDGTGHMGPLEKVDEWAQQMASWIGMEAQRWQEDEQLLEQVDLEKSKIDPDGHLALSSTWAKWVMKATDVRRSDSSKL